MSWREAALSKMIKKILVPVDLSQEDAGGSALQLAADLARLKEAKLVLFHVIERVPAFVESQLPKSFAEDAVSEATRRLTALAGSLQLESHAEIAVRQGHPSTEILEYSEEAGIDMIVMASHDPVLSDYLLGSVAARVVRHAHCSVLVARKLDD